MRGYENRLLPYRRRFARQRTGDRVDAYPTPLPALTCTWAAQLLHEPLLKKSGYAAAILLVRPIASVVSSLILAED